MDRSYFTKYCGRGSYDDEYLHYSRVWHCVNIVERFEIPVESVLVLGAATGRVLEHFERAWAVRPWGCELSRWAHERIPARFRRRIERADMRRYVPGLARKNMIFDLTFCNALVYLERQDIQPVLEQLSALTMYFHYWSSTSEEHEPNDPYRVILESKRWWAEQFRTAGFTRTRSPYLWRSVKH